MGITLELFNCIKPLFHSSQICDHLLYTIQAFHYMGSCYVFANTCFWCSGVLDSHILHLLNELKARPWRPVFASPLNGGAYIIHLISKGKKVV